MKLIILLREPISRAYSQYIMEVNRRKGYKKNLILMNFLKKKI